MHKYDLYNLSSRFEGYPNTLLEAIIAGMPIISSDCNYGPKILIKNKKNGLLFKNENYNDQISKINFLINNKSYFKYLGINAKKSISLEKTNNENENKWIKLIKEK